MRILLADDQPHIRSALRLLLDQEPNLTVVGEAVDTQTLCTQIQVTKPDLLLLDWELPGWPETDLLTILRFLYPKLLIIALSGQLEAREAALSAGADFFISKSHPPEQLLSTLRTIQHPYNNGKSTALLKKEEVETRSDEAELASRTQFPSNGEESLSGLPFWYRNGKSDSESARSGFAGSAHQPGTA